ncbi:MAG: Hsp70 family protein [Bacteroidota bacterium]
MSTKINYGIDLGTTNSAIARMEKGKAVIQKTDTLKDTMPSCVAFNRKGKVMVGDKAFNQFAVDKRYALTKDGYSENSFVEFKRTMGTDSTFYASNMDKKLSSEELSAEVLKKLRSFVSNDDLQSIVITVPARFTINQKDATRRSADLAGFKHCELLQEPIAASLAYGIDAEEKDGYWIVFDFGGGTFDVVLMKVEDGIMKVVDTGGNNHLGGKNIDSAIIEEIIIPYLKDSYEISSLLNGDKKEEFKEMWKAKAEEAKIQLSFDDSYMLMTDLGEDYGTDDNGETLELDLTINQENIKNVAGPIFQRTIDLTKELLKRNNLKADNLDELILIGGSTLSPILRDMVTDQIKSPNTDIDPITAVAKGAALYASTIDVSEEVKELNRDKTKIQLDVRHESSTVEKEEFVTIKTLPEKTDGKIPDPLYVEVTRGDKAWSSGKFPIDKNGDVIDVQLEAGKTNSFSINVFDDEGKGLPNEPKEFTIIQGSKIGSATLPLNIGIAINHRETKKTVFSSIEGLEKNQSLPAVGVQNGLKTQQEIRPGNENDYLKIPIYQGDEDAEGSRPIYNEYVYDVVISGEDIPSLLPKKSDVDLTVKVDRSEEISLEAYFPYLDYSTTIDVPTDQVQNEIEKDWLANELSKAKGSLKSLKESDYHQKEDEIAKIGEEIQYLEKRFNQRGDNVDTKKEILNGLRKQFKKIDRLNESTEWPELESKLKEAFSRLEEANKDLGDEKSNQLVNDLRKKVDQVIREQDIKTGNALLQDIENAFVQLTLIYQLINFVKYHDQNFNSFHWKDKNQARQLLNKGKQLIAQNPTQETLHPIVIELIQLLPEQEQPEGDKSLLTG